MNTQQAQELLANLGGSPDQVANSLQALGIKGTHTCFSCPIAKLLIDNGASYGRCAVGSMIQISSSESFKPPIAIKSFIDAFDAGAYPQLELENK